MVASRTPCCGHLRHFQETGAVNPVVECLLNETVGSEGVCVCVCGCDVGCGVGCVCVCVLWVQCRRREQRGERPAVGRLHLQAKLLHPFHHQQNCQDPDSAGTDALSVR